MSLATSLRWEGFNASNMTSSSNRFRNSGRKNCLHFSMTCLRANSELFFSSRYSDPCSIRTYQLTYVLLSLSKSYSSVEIMQGRIVFTVSITHKVQIEICSPDFCSKNASSGSNNSSIAALIRSTLIYVTLCRIEQLCVAKIVHTCLKFCLLLQLKREISNNRNKSTRTALKLWRMSTWIDDLTWILQYVKKIARNEKNVW